MRSHRQRGEKKARVSEEEFVFIATFLTCMDNLFFIALHPRAAVRGSPCARSVAHPTEITARPLVSKHTCFSFQPHWLQSLQKNWSTENPVSLSRTGWMQTTSNMLFSKYWCISKIKKMCISFLESTTVIVVLIYTVYTAVQKFGISKMFNVFF